METLSDEVDDGDDDDDNTMGGEKTLEEKARIDFVSHTTLQNAIFYLKEVMDSRMATQIDQVFGVRKF